MSVLLRASELEGRPIVTFAGESPAEVKDVIFDSLNGALLGLTLRGHGLFSRSRKDVLPWSRIHGIGRDAVVIRDEDAFQGSASLPAEGTVLRRVEVALANGRGRVVKEHTFGAGRWGCDCTRPEDRSGLPADPRRVGAESYLSAQDRTQEPLARKAQGQPNEA